MSNFPVFYSHYPKKLASSSLRARVQLQRRRCPLQSERRASCPHTMDREQSYTTTSTQQSHKMLNHQFWISRSILENISVNDAVLPPLRIATPQSPSFCPLHAHNPWAAAGGWQPCHIFGQLTFLYLCGKVNLSMVFCTAPRLTLPSLSSSCSSSCGKGTAAKCHQHCSWEAAVEEQRIPNISETGVDSEPRLAGQETKPHRTAALRLQP